MRSRQDTGGRTSSGRCRTTGTPTYRIHQRIFLDTEAGYRVDLSRHDSLDLVGDRAEAIRFAASVNFDGENVVYDSDLAQRYGAAIVKAGIALAEAREAGEPTEGFGEVLEVV